MGRQFGVIEPGKFDLRHKLTANEKRSISATYNAHKELFNRPQDFHITVVSNATAKNITGASKKIKNKNGKTRLFIPIEKDEKVRIQKGKIVKSRAGLKETIISGGWDLYEKAKKAFDSLKPGEAISFQIGGSPKFSQYYTRPEDFNMAMNYLRTTGTDPNSKNWHTGPNNSRGDVAPLIEHFSVVKFDIKYLDNSGAKNAKKKKTAKKNRRH